ncbi:hypothetical protein C8Q80DRAFT_909982 [Daedaleopsis nitida]|nr:hypothetical protein C8Q80DRAFT_909982 [Daedaleopsis nitida]
MRVLVENVWPGPVEDAAPSLPRRSGGEFGGPVGSVPYPSTRAGRQTARPRKKKAAPSIADHDHYATEHAAPTVPPVRQSGTSSRPSRTSRPATIDIGVPTREGFFRLEEQYIDALDKSKRVKALISQEMFDDIWLVLNFPNDSKIKTPQFRWWVRKMFTLVHQDALDDEIPCKLETSPSEERVQDAMRQLGREDFVVPIVVHDGKRLAIREHIYNIICVCHLRVGHGGRDRTAAAIRKVYTWVPKELILLFIKNCPTCIAKKNGTLDRMGPMESTVPPVPDVLPVARFSGFPVLGNSAYANVVVPLPTTTHEVYPPPGMAVFSNSQYLHLADGPFPQLLPSNDGPGCEQLYQAHVHSCDSLEHFGSRLPPTPDTHAPPPWRFIPLKKELHLCSEDAPTIRQPQYIPMPTLPSIHLCSPGRGTPTYGSGNVTLPSLSEVLSGALSGPALHPSSVLVGLRHPLQPVAHNYNPEHVEAYPAGVHSYAPPAVRTPHFSGVDPEMAKIDPRLLQEDVGMLMLTEETTHRQEGNRYKAGWPST